MSIKTFKIFPIFYGNFKHRFCRFTLTAVVTLLLIAVIIIIVNNWIRVLIT